MRVALATILLLGLSAAAEAADLKTEPNVVIETLVVEPVEVRPIRRVVTVRRGCTRCPGAGLPWCGLREPRVAEVPWGGLDGPCPPVGRTVRSAMVRVRG
jgi:hypothetical protein